MLEIKNISKYFEGRAAVHHLSFDVEEGETFVLLGTSGCGKTTTLKMINRLINPDEGEVVIRGKVNTDLQIDLLRRELGYVIQNHGLFPHYTILENIAVVPKLLHWKKEKIAERANVLLSKFKLPPKEFLRAYPEQLSGGQQQRVGFVRALMANPSIILMDEPLGALDPITRNQIQEEFKQLDELQGKTIVMVTHNIMEAIALGDRICLMDAGEVQQIGKPTELLLHPANSFVEDFFSTNSLVFKMRALSLRSLFPFLKITTSDAPKNIISAEKDVMEALEKLSEIDLEKEILAVEDGHNQQFYKIDSSALFSAFQNCIKSN